MNFFGGIKSVLGSPAAGNQPSPHETIERLCDRVSSSTLLEDRRDAVRALKSLSKKFRLEVGTQSMELMIGVLQTERNDTEIIGMALETLCNIMSTDPQMQDGQTPAKNGPTPSDSDVGLQFTEIFIKNPDNVTLLLGILEEYDFHVRWPTVKLLTMLLTNKPNLLQQCILVSPMGVSRLMDLLSDSREIIRNEGLLLLIQLTKSNAAIQKIVAFENAFDRLLEIIAEEGYSDGGIVVEDCLHLMNNLLKDNVSNQNFFREGSFIQRFTPFFEMSALAMQGDGEAGWSEQKVSNVQLMLKVVRILVSPDNPQQATTSAQKIMNQSGLLKLLCGILMASGIPADILTETINAVSEVIRGFPANQEYFSQVTAPSQPPRPAIVVLLMSMINEKQPFSLRCAVLYCFQCYLYKNDQGQSQIVSTLLPSSTDVAATVSAGQLLCAGLFSHDPVSNWCAAVALSHCLKGNPTQKEQLLRVQLATSLGNPPVSLLQQSTNILAQGGDIQTRVGLLLLLCSWLSNCPIAVAHFLHNSANVPYLMAQVESHGEEGERLVGYLCGLLLGLCLAFNDDSVEKFQKDDLRLLINKRIGLDNLLEKIGYISKSEYFTAAVKSPEIKGDGSQLVLFDHEFTKLFKKLDASVTKAVEETTEAPQTTNQKNDSIENHDSIVQSYKELIREQDEELGKIKSRYADMESTYNQANTQLQIQAQEILQLRSQLSLMQSYNQHQQEQAELNGSYVPADSPDLSNLRLQMGELQLNKQELETKLKEKEERVQRLEKDLEVSHAQYAVATAAAELADSCDSSELAAGLTRNQLEDLAGLRRTVSSLEQDVSSLRTQNASLQKELESFTHGTATTSGTQLQTSERIRELEARLAQVIEEKDSQNQEHEDLLVMLTEQGEKLAKYKKTLKDLGQEVSADEEEEEDEEDEEGDEDDGEEEEEEKNEADEQGDDQTNYQPEEQLTPTMAETPQQAPAIGLQEEEAPRPTKDEAHEELLEETRYPVEEHAPKDPFSYPLLKEGGPPDQGAVKPPAHLDPGQIESQGYYGFHEQVSTESYPGFQEQDQSESAFYQGEGYHASQEQAPSEPYYHPSQDQGQMESYPAQTESSGYHPSQEQGHVESFGYGSFQDQPSSYDPYQNHNHRPGHDAGYSLQEQAHAHQQAPIPYAVEEQANIKPKPVPFFTFPQNTNQPNNFSSYSQSDEIKQDAGLMMDNGESNFFT